MVGLRRRLRRLAGKALSCPRSSRISGAPRPNSRQLMRRLWRPERNRSARQKQRVCAGPSSLFLPPRNPHTRLSLVSADSGLAKTCDIPNGRKSRSVLTVHRRGAALWPLGKRGGIAMRFKTFPDDDPRANPALRTNNYGSHHKMKRRSAAAAKSRFDRKVDAPTILSIFN